jgi:hypothetical protein
MPGGRKIAGGGAKRGDAGGFQRVGFGSVRRDRSGEERICRTGTRRLGFYPAFVGAPDALKLASNTSGAHRTRAQIAPKGARPPDAGHRTLI